MNNDELIMWRTTPYSVVADYRDKVAYSRWFHANKELRVAKLKIKWQKKIEKGKIFKVVMMKKTIQFQLKGGVIYKNSIATFTTPDEFAYFLASGGYKP